MPEPNTSTAAERTTAADVLQLVADVLSVDNCQRYAAERYEPGEYAIAVTNLVGSVTGIINAVGPSQYAIAAVRLRDLVVGDHGQCPECGAALGEPDRCGVCVWRETPQVKDLPGRADSMTHLSDPTTTVRAMTVRELIQALTVFASAGELPRGLDTPVEVGLTHPEDNTFETYAAIQIDRATGIWPGRAGDGTDCRHTTVQLTGEPNHPDAGRYNGHPLHEHPDWEDPR